MADFNRMVSAARRALVKVLELDSQDRVLVVQDPLCLKCGEAFADAARAEGCATTTYLLPADGRPLKTLPEGMALEGHDVVINAMSGSSDEVPFRIEWLELVEARNLRCGHSPNIHEDMMDGGPMDVDYDLMVGQADRLMDALNGAVSVRMTAPAGTNITMDIRGREFITDVKITDTVKGCNLPCGEVFCCPVETGAEGVVVADGPIGGEGQPPTPVRLKVKGGRVVDATCDDGQWAQRINQLLDTDHGARTVAELGIGLNPKARLVGIMLEDEKALETAHIAFGSNIGMPGGVSESTTHIDYLILRPTIVVRGKDGSELTISEDGRFLI